MDAHTAGVGGTPAEPDTPRVKQRRNYRDSGMASCGWSGASHARGAGLLVRTRSCLAWLAVRPLHLRAAVGPVTTFGRIRPRPTARSASARIIGAWRWSLP